MEKYLHGDSIIAIGLGLLMALSIIVLNFIGPIEIGETGFGILISVPLVLMFVAFALAGRTLQ